MERKTLVDWDLGDIVNSLIEHHPEIRELYLFGSRAYKTGSYRSDIDILAVTGGEMVSVAEVNTWLHHEYPPVDLFLSFDRMSAASVVNGSVLRYRKNTERGYADLVDQLDAKKLWDAQSGFSAFDGWIQKALADGSFPMSIIPDSSADEADQKIADALKELERTGIKTYYAGSSWQDIGKSITEMVRVGLQKPSKFQRRARNFSFDTIRLENEYDFQNLIHLLLRPVFPDMEREPVTVRIDGNAKLADFGIASNRIVIETKYIDSTGKKAEVLKTLEGLRGFYAQNPNVECLLFLVLYEGSVDIDVVNLESRFSHTFGVPPVRVCFFENPYPVSRR